MMRSGLPLLMVAAMIAAGCQTVPYQTTDPATVESVVFSRSEKDLAKAMAVFLYGRIREGEQRRSPAVALPYYDMAANLAPGSHTIQGRIAVAALLRADIQAAISALETSLAAKPDDPTRQIDLAALYQLANRNDDAARIFEQTIAVAPTNTVVYLALSDIYLQQGEDAHAIEILNKGFGAVEDTQMLSAFLYQKTREFVASGKLQRAIRFFELVSEWNEHDRTKIGYVVSEWYLAQQRAMEALHQKVLLAMAAAQEQIGRYEDASETLEKLLEHFPDNHLAMNFLAYMWAEQNTRIEDAYELSRKSLEWEPQNGAYLDTLGWIYFRKGVWDQALEYLEKANAMIPDDYEINLHLGDVHAARGNEDLASQYWQQSLLVNPVPANRAWQQLESIGIDPAAWLSSLPTDPEQTEPANEAE